MIYKIYVFAPRIVVKLYNTNQQNAQFYKLIFNFSCLLQVSNLVGSSSGRELCMQYGMFYTHRCEQSGEHTFLSTRLLTPMHVNTTYCTHNCFLSMRPTRFKRCWRQQILNINLENYVFPWFLFYSDMQLQVTFKSIF